MNISIIIKEVLLFKIAWDKKIKRQFMISNVKFFFLNKYQEQKNKIVSILPKLLTWLKPKAYRKTELSSLIIIRFGIIPINDETITAEVVKVAV